MNGQEDKVTKKGCPIEVLGREVDVVSKGVGNVGVVLRRSHCIDICVDFIRIRFVRPS